MWASTVFFPFSLFLFVHFPFVFLFLLLCEPPLEPTGERGRNLAHLVCCPVSHVGLTSLAVKEPWLNINARQCPKSGSQSFKAWDTVVRSGWYGSLKNNFILSILFLNADKSGIWLFSLKVRVKKPIILGFSGISVAGAAEAAKFFCDWQELGN